MASYWSTQRKKRLLLSGGANAKLGEGSVAGLTSEIGLDEINYRGTD